MGLAAFNRMRQLQAEKESKKTEASKKKETKKTEAPKKKGRDGNGSRKN